jgi:anthranilate 1,2-dioxygenase small subunit
MRGANIDEAQRYRHFVSGVLIDAVADGIASVRSNYLVLRTMQDGALSVFSAGCYLDRVDLSRAEPILRAKIVAFDNKRIDTLLAIPL